MSLLTIGTVAFDDIQTPFGHAERVIGGAATYIAVSASYFLQDIRLVSVVGGDFPETELDYLRSRGVNLDGLQIKPDEKSFFWAGKYHQDLNTRDTLATELNVLADFNPVVPQHFLDADFVMLGNLTPAVQRQVIEQFPTRPKLIALDTMNFWISSALDDLKTVLTMVDVLIINDEEARQLTAEHSLVKAARAIHAMGPRYLVIKKGEHGALLFYNTDEDPTSDQIFFAPALPLAEVFDPTGAGDTFAGGFIGYLAKTGDISFDNMKRAVIYGSAMASYCVEAFSLDRLKELDEELVQQRVDRFVKLVNFDINRAPSAL
jgi:sugar/nucleoside kinase (ribokinase family)